ncbi:uncharacterized protein SPPG_04917 [Spizellomyces punctatus DAOM BR117]|uniref:Leucine carboxyl methyltransferase 1 n=1 Tax=Spizellomyces punctatus (strain DAOM BR117) TaxID=645134 RepID=A0A0L0HES1_SPIPD|nr:uncharacterized protein SPPG_04917 [Spizellomyces punctatus DAOM BR117]KNC99526.1 hypothetical protein SPPG_04917 [Spizellomyces punctatus DAOM BR117]|eukprot:XP_016607566.1 hypothetical protein SPPG_04917 [Spizellomyces punctatus DAOM BR117]
MSSLWPPPLAARSAPVFHESGLSGDDAVRATNDDAAISRLAAVNQGYLSDPYAKHFVRRPQRRPPVINRGSYTRSKALDTLVQQFLKSGDGSPKTKQIVSLGAGSDTRWFLLKAQDLHPARYYEIDFPEITGRKAQIIKKNNEMTELLGEHLLTSGGTELHSDNYHLIPGDLRNFSTEILPRIASLGFDKSLPTLFLSECVLIYMSPRDSANLVQSAAESIESGVFVTYEQILPDDPFGVTMLQNLKMRGIELLGIRAHPSLQSQRDRYLIAGWDEAGAVDMNMFWERILDSDERTRVSALEIFDEVEEWRLLSGHYCVSWGIKTRKGADNGLKNVGLWELSS